MFLLPRRTGNQVIREKIMSRDSQPTQPFHLSANHLHPFAAKAVTLSFALLLGACAATGDKTAEIQAPETQASETVSSESVETASQPTAAELMKTLQAPLKEPEPATPQPVEKTTETAAAQVPATAESKTARNTVEQAVENVVNTTQQLAEKVTKTTEKVAQKAVEAAQDKAAGKAAADAVDTQERERKVAAVSKPATAAEPAPAEKKAPEQVAETKTVPAATGALSDVKAFSVTSKQLPFSYDIWTIRKGNTPLTQGLVIVTPTWEMGKEGYMSQIWLTLMEDNIHVNSSSDIETASKGLGIRIDGGDLIPFSRVAETNIGVIEGKWLDRLARAEKIEVYLGFFPGKKPTSDTFKSDLSLNNLDRIVATYRLLNR
jgi:hypothetical protein